MEKEKILEKLKKEGHRIINSKRGFITIERCDESNESPEKITGWGTIKLTIYSDKDIAEGKDPKKLYINLDRYNSLSQFYFVDSNCEQYKLGMKQIRSEF